jgi:uncharacterized protein involved in outer membrane biogenesis
MKKLLIRISIALVVLLILGVLAVSLFLDGAVKRGIETVGPMLAKVEIKLDSVSLSLLSGSGKVKGLLVGNPEGFKAPSAIQVGEASLALQPSSVFGDKVVIKSVLVHAPEITFETDLKQNNLSKILANLQAATGGAETSSTNTPTQTKPGRKLQVDDFLISGGKIHVSLTTLGGKSATVALPEVHLTDLGKGPDGITGAELATRVIKAIEKEAVQASSGVVSDLAKDAAGLTKNLDKNAAGAADKLGQGIGGLFKKK